MNLLYGLVGSIITMAIFWVIVYKGKQVAKFIISDTGDDRRSKKYLKRILLNFCLFTFIIAFITVHYIILAVTIPIWFIAILAIGRFTKLWKASGYSALVLILLVIIIIVFSFVSTYFIREFVVIPLIREYTNLL